MRCVCCSAVGRLSFRCSHRLTRWQRKKGQTALPCFCHSDGSARFPTVTTNGDLMTELAASAIALMLTIELAVAIACVAAWFELQRASEGRSAKQADGVAAARTPEARWLAFAATLPLGPWAVGNACVYRNGKSPVTPLPPNGARPANTMAEVTLAVSSPRSRLPRPNLARSGSAATPAGNP